MIRVLRATAVAAACALSVLLLAEAGLRLLAMRYPIRYYFDKAMSDRMFTAWNAPSQPSPLHPPFPVYANIGLDDAERMDRVFADAALPKNARMVGSDFLRSPLQARESLFRVTTNSFGFRDPPRPKRKPRGTIRVICLGDYEIFGQGVDDADTLPRRLEARLNAGGKARYEVWNGGRQSATAILGLARLRREIFDYEPDLLILQYGMVDINVLGDKQNLRTLVFPTPRSFSFMRRALEDAARLVNASFLIRRVNRLVVRNHRNRNGRRWGEAMNRMLALAQEHGVPVLLLDRPHQERMRPAFERLSARWGASFVSVHDAFRRFPPSSADWRDFESRPNWASELPGRLARRRPWPFMCYHTNLYHLNRRGYEVVARALEPVVLKALAGRRRASQKAM